MNARTIPACPDKIADKPALLAGLLLQRDAEIRELREALSDCALVINGLWRGTLPQCFRPSLEMMNTVNGLLAKYAKENAHG